MAFPGPRRQPSALTTLRTQLRMRPPSGEERSDGGGGTGPPTGWQESNDL